MNYLDTVRNNLRVSLDAGVSVDDNIFTFSEADFDLLSEALDEGQFNMILWNSTDYANPTSDPDHELVRMLSVYDPDSFTVNVDRHQENSTAAARDDDTKTYSLALGITAKMIVDIDYLLYEIINYVDTILTLNIGMPVGAGSGNSSLYVDQDGLLAQSGDYTYDPDTGFRVAFAGNAALHMDVRRGEYRRGDMDFAHNGTYDFLDDTNKTYKVCGGVPSYGEISFFDAGSGVDSMSIDGIYIGAYSQDIIITIDGVNFQRVLFNLVGSAFSVGDTMTGDDTGSTGTITETDGVSYMIIAVDSGGDFSGDSSFTNQDLVTALIDSCSARYDTVNVSAGDFFEANVPLTDTIDMGNGMIADSTDQPSDHTINDSWTLSIVVNQSSKFTANFLDGSVGMGDMDGNENSQMVKVEKLGSDLSAWRATISDGDDVYLNISRQARLYQIGEISSRKKTHFEVNTRNHNDYFNFLSSQPLFVHMDLPAWKNGAEAQSTGGLAKGDLYQGSAGAPVPFAVYVVH